MKKMKYYLFFFKEENNDESNINLDDINKFLRKVSRIKGVGVRRKIVFVKKFCEAITDNDVEEVKKTIKWIHKK